MQCAGFCTEGSYYLFSDVRNGVPINGNCKSEIVEKVQKNATPFGVVMLTIGLVGFAGMVLSFVICNLSSRRFKGQPQYNYAKYGMSKDE